jgi:DNA-binding transcriptional ArsR family regulator
MTSDAGLDATFGALADPTRRAIVARLARGEAGLSELAVPFDMSLPAVSKHLSVLERAGLISRGRDAQRRPCRLNVEPLQAAVAWVEYQRGLCSTHLDRLDAYLQQLQDETAPPTKKTATKTARKTKPQGRRKR